jgi:hypothetical protein
MSSVIHPTALLHLAAIAGFLAVGGAADRDLTTCSRADRPPQPYSSPVPGAEKHASAVGVEIFNFPTRLGSFMNRHVAREAAVYGVAPGAATVAALALVGYFAAGRTGAFVVLVVSLHVTALAVVMLARSARDRNLDYAEGAYHAGTTDGTDVEALVEPGTGGTTGRKQKAFLYSAATTVLTLAALALLYGL